MTRATASPADALSQPPAIPVGSGQERLWLAALLAGTLVVYGGALFGGFVWDDDTVVLPAASRPPLAAFRQVFTGGVSVEGVGLGYYRPLVDLSYALDGWLWGRRPFGFHLTNLLLYGMCVAVAARLALRLFGVGLAAAAAAAAFALHPVHVESVAWVQGRGDLLAFLGVAASILAFLRSLRAGSAWAWRGLAGLALLGAALAKEWALVAPVLALVCWAFTARGDATPAAAPGRARRATARDLGAALSPFAAALTAYATLRLAAQAGAAGGAATAHLPMGDRWLILTPTLAQYVGLLLWPHPLSAYHVVPVPAGPAELRVVAGGLLLAAIVGVAVWAARRAPRTALALWWFLLALLPVLPLWPLKAFTMAERYLFLPSFGFALAVGLLAERAWRSLASRPARWALGAGGAAVALAWGAAASARVPDWVDPIEFYRAMLRTAPDFALAHTNLGALLVAEGSVEEGMRHLERALALRPDMPEAHSNLGLAFVKRGDASRAIAELETAVRLRPHDARILGDFVRALVGLRRFPEAVGVLHRMEALQPGSPDVARRLAEAYAALGERGRAEHYAALAERLDGRLPGAAGGAR